MAYPNRLAVATKPLPANLTEAGARAVDHLGERGVEVVAGLTHHYARGIMKMSQQRGILEYCPKENTDKRFATMASTRRWLAKNDGRGVFLLRERSQDGDGALLGYGWTGAEPNKHVPDAVNTFAVRIGQEGAGKHLSKAFTRLILDGSKVLFGGTDFALETWESNERAVAGYNEVGFVKVHEEADTRPSLFSGRDVADVRLFMSFPNELLPAA